MPSHQEIATDWGTSRVYVTRQIKAGCPSDTLEAARAWRAARAQRQPRSKRVTQPVAKSEQEATSPSWHELLTTDDQDGASGLEESLCGARRIEATARKMVEVAQAERQDPLTVAALLRNYNTAMAGRVAVEKSFRIELLERRQLWPVAECKAQTSALVRLVLNRLDSLPAEAGPQCNQQDPHHSTAILTRAVGDIRKELLRSLQAFEEG